MSRPVKVVARILPAALLLGVSLWALAFQRREMAQNPSDAEWARAQAVVREGFQEGDVVRTAPIWADQARARMYEFPFDLAQRPEDQELFRYERLWIIADAEHADSALEELPEGYAVVESWRPTERTAVHLIDIPPADGVLLDAVMELDSAIITRDYGDREQVCDTVRDGRYYCGDVDPWLYVESTRDEVGDSIRRCIWVAAVPDAEIRLTWLDQVLGSRIDGNIGNTMASRRADRGSDIDFRVEIDSQVQTSLRFGKWDEPYYPFEVDTSALAGQAHDVSLVVHAADFFDRWVCLRARVLR